MGDDRRKYWVPGKDRESNGFSRVGLWKFGGASWKSGREIWGFIQETRRKFGCVLVRTEGVSGWRRPKGSAGERALGVSGFIGEAGGFGMLCGRPRGAMRLR